MDIRKIRDILGDQAAPARPPVQDRSRRARSPCRRPRYVDDIFTRDAIARRACSARCSGCSTHGRLGDTGYLSILPVDQGIEHSAGASFAPNPMMFDPENIVKLAIEGGCNAVASTFGVLGIDRAQVRAQDPVHRQDQPQRAAVVPEHVRPDDVRQRPPVLRHGRAGVGATVYWGSPESRRQLQEIAEAFAEAHELGMFTVLWCYVRNNAFKTATGDQTLSADLTGQANHLGVTIQADIIKQKLPEGNGGYNDPALKGFGKTHKKVYSELTTDNPIDLTRYQVANCYMGRIGLINSGGASGRQRPARRGQDRGHQQARRRHGPDRRPQGVPAPVQGRRRAAQRDPGRLPVQGRHGRVATIAGR